MHRDRLARKDRPVSRDRPGLPGRRASPGPQGLPGPQGQQGWAPEPGDQPKPVTEWAGPPPAAAPALESGLAMMFRPMQLFASAYADLIKAQQQAWAAMIGAARGSERSSR